MFSLPRIVGRQKLYPGIKDLPQHIRMDFRNTFIRLVIRGIFNSEEPWVNPELSTLQSMYSSIYPAYPARLQLNDAVFHPVSPKIYNALCKLKISTQTVTSLGVVRNRIGTAALFAVQRHLVNVFRQKRLQTLDARAMLVSQKFRSDDDHPFIWHQYVVGDIPNHPGTGGYQTVSSGEPC